MIKDSRREDLFAGLSVAVMLIGTATGSAIAMMVMSLTLLVILLLFQKPKIRTGSMLIAMVAAASHSSPHARGRQE